ncbi:hypothetical protein [Pararhizobium sp. IMCC21322]|uniref:hypothetical protein n=1 Tax=Pararhizobium sp. IMCC21322 TaxID=3067903 RepID=UPI002740C8C0|nr:hypothetical protein [Pararhizobium sp. IMCC21322]
MLDGILNPQLFEAIRDHTGLTTLAMLLIAGLALALLKGAPVVIRVALLLVIVAIYVAVIFLPINGEIAPLVPPEENTPTTAPECEERRVLAAEETYWSDTNRNVGISLGGGGTMPVNRAFLNIDKNCNIYLRYSAGARSGNQKFPTNGNAPWVLISIFDKAGNPMKDKSGSYIDKKNTESVAIISDCGGSMYATKAIDFIDKSDLDNIDNFDLSMSGVNPQSC